MRGNIAQLMQQAQKMQENLARAQEELATLEVSGQSGGGMVQVTLTGKMDVRRVRIDKAAVGDDLEMLEDLIAAAYNDARAKADQVAGEEMAKMQQGLGLPPGFKLPF